MRTIRTVLAPVRGHLAVAVVLQVLASLAQVGALLSLALLAGAVVRDGWQPSEWQRIWLALGLLAIGTLLAGAASTASHLADNKLLLVLRRRMVDRLARVRLGWFTSQGAASVKKFVQDDTSSMHHLVAHALLDITAVIVVPVVALVMLLVVAPALAVLVLVLAVVAYLLFQKAMAGAGARMAEYAQGVGELEAAAVEAVDGVDVVRPFSRRENRPSRLRRAAHDFHDFFLGWVGETRLITAVAFVMASPATAVVAVATAGGILVALGVHDVPQVVTALVLGPVVSAPVNTIGTRIQALQGGMMAAAAVQEVCELPTLPVTDKPVPVTGTTVEVDGIGFSHEPGKPVLEDVSFTLQPGTLTAVVGPSGAGKSTLASLLARFEDPDSGRIRLGGSDLRDLAPEELYRTIGFVFQDVALLREPVREVIRMGRDVSDEAVEEAARAANIHDRIMELPRGYDAEVGRDVEFSGGEAQRIAIARALLADTPVLVLDEATAYADPESEARVQQALSRLAAGRTVMVVAHRLSTIRNADQILVLQDGRLVQRGTHAELVGVPGAYKDLCTSGQEEER